VVISSRSRRNHNRRVLQAHNFAGMINQMIGGESRRAIQRRITWR